MLSCGLILSAWKYIKTLMSYNTQKMILSFKKTVAFVLSRLLDIYEYVYKHANIYVSIYPYTHTHTQVYEREMLDWQRNINLIPVGLESTD